MSEPLPSLAYEMPGERPRARWFAWVPLVAMAIVAVTPLVYARYADWAFASVYRDFGLKVSATMQRAIDFLYWYGLGYGWLFAAAAIVALHLSLSRLGRWARITDRRDAAIWLLASACLSMAIALVLSHVIDGAEAMRQLSFGISAGGAVATPSSSIFAP